MRRSLVSLALLLLLVDACAQEGGTGEAPSREDSFSEEWTAPSDYGFELRSSCGERTLIGRFRIVVSEGTVVEARGLDMSARVITRSKELSEQIPTLDELLDEADEARSAGADTVEVAYDESDGHPTDIEIDYDGNALDDEACYAISDYQARPAE